MTVHYLPGVPRRVPTAVIVVAAGSGERLGESVPKAFVELDDRTILQHAVSRIAKLPAVDLIVVVVPGRLVVRARLDVMFARPRVHVTAGGAQRSDSVRAGIEHITAVAPETEVILVHDAARPLTPTSVFDRVVDAVTSGHRAVVPGIPVVDTLKEVAVNGEQVAVRGTVDRETLRAIQTPQGFSFEALTRAYADPTELATDDAGLAERSGIAVHVVDGDALAFKITTPWDLRIARSVVAESGPEELS
ncbi:2-C-methyl-D-erythritol 4-phosphate cytidylyltransferase [Gordonia effusa NBRC 100432]|uniref:2-C-methyl-D-erythritol 4-phosphate cytidylyltransferase n=1 Tax=Gordonia effusa NBRC 100432 TaxID=1077974 RepID=H0R095_9ACTN|nr:2-C-methyl-D-erythritol 4-phosphate cytidylyltransferase [Gordonia effusa]GAB18496.1 2-C-methyl-D-erythritol 4-phosphate cytidylyltransferase [Gordonia effusa NBRC 100432]